MLRSSRDSGAGATGHAAWQRLRTALCLDEAPGTGGVHAVHGGRASEQGSAVVEFTFLALLLMVPIVYFIITVGQLQGGSFAVVGAADQAAKVFVSQPDAESGRAAAEQAAMLALADYGHAAANARVESICRPADCFASGSAVTVTVQLDVQLPFVPFNDSLQLGAGHLAATATQVVGRFR